MKSLVQPPREEEACDNFFRERVIACIQERIFDPNLKLEQVAARMRVSRFHFCRLFKKYMGESFREYVTRLRVEAATARLLSGGCSVTEVCFAVGYNDLTHFGRVFRKITGCTPSSIRERAIRGDPPAGTVASGMDDDGRYEG